MIRSSLGTFRGLATARRPPKASSFSPVPPSPNSSKQLNSSASVIITQVAWGAIGLVVGVSATLALQNDEPRRPSASTPRRDGIPIDGVTKSPSTALGGLNRVGEIFETPNLNGSMGVEEMAGHLLLPGSIGPVSDFLQRQAYTAAYDRRNRIPAWTAEYLTAEGLKGLGNRQDVQFSEDVEIPEQFRARLLDYFKSGYDRGHMVPAADAKGTQEAMSQTFLLSNIAPQVGEGFNRHYWAYLEQFCRDLTKSFEDVYVFTVPLFLPRQSSDGKWRVTYEMIAPQDSAPSIAVPTHFAKVIIASKPPSCNKAFSLIPGLLKSKEKDWSVGAFVLPNAAIPDEAKLESFSVPVQAVERSAGLTLLPSGLKTLARPLCQTIECQVVVRRFDDTQKKLTSGENRGNGKGDQRRRERSATM